MSRAESLEVPRLAAVYATAPSRRRPKVATVAELIAHSQPALTEPGEPTAAMLDAGVAAYQSAMQLGTTTRQLARYVWLAMYDARPK